MNSKNTPSPFRPTPRVDILTHTDALDVVGDLHGCAAETITLMEALGHRIHLDNDPNTPADITFAPGRRIAFLGDLTDRGPRSVDTLRIVEGTLLAGGSCVMGNHDNKLLRALAGHPINIGNGLEKTLAELETVAPETKDRWRDMLLALPHQVRAPDTRLSADGFLTLAHACAPTHHQDQENKNSLQRAMYGYADGSTDSNGNLIREDWAQDYTGPRAVLHGHTPMGAPQLKNRVGCLDTGAVFGGSLTTYATDSGLITQITSGVCAKERPGVTRANPVFGIITQFPLEPVETPVIGRVQAHAR